MRGVFITGTDTGVGKTFLACQLARALRGCGISVGLYKPACSGSEQSPLDGSRNWPDLECLSAALDHQFPREWICPQTFHAATAPPLAAAQENRTVDALQLRTGIDVWKEQVDLLLVEGVGGWLCPLTKQETIADLAMDLGFPVLIVAANRLGTINHTLLTIQSIENSQLKIIGAVVNNAADEQDGTEQTNTLALRSLTDVPIFGPQAWINDSQQSHQSDETDETIKQILKQLSELRILPESQYIH